MWIFTLGEPCNVDGSPLDPNSPEPTINIKDPDDWTPYDSHLAFETAEFAYKRCKSRLGILTFCLSFGQLVLLHTMMLRHSQVIQIFAKRLIQHLSGAFPGEACLSLTTG